MSLFRYEDSRIALNNSDSNTTLVVYVVVHSADCCPTELSRLLQHFYRPTATKYNQKRSVISNIHREYCCCHLANAAACQFVNADLSHNVKRIVDDPEPERTKKVSRIARKIESLSSWSNLSKIRVRSQVFELFWIQTCSLKHDFLRPRR